MTPLTKGLHTGSNGSNNDMTINFKKITRNINQSMVSLTSTALYAPPARLNRWQQEIWPNAHETHKNL